jgi:hypothetical protein
MEAISTLRNRSVKERNKRGLIRRERACILLVVVPLDEAVALRDAGLAVAALPRVQEWVGLLQRLLLMELEELPHDHPPSGKLFVERASGGAGGRFREERVRRRSVLFFGVSEDGRPELQWFAAGGGWGFFFLKFSG